MKRPTIGLAIVFGAAICGFGLSRLRTGEVSPLRADAFRMCVTRDARPSHVVWRGPVLASVARTLAPEDRASLEEALSLSITRWEARENPFLEDLEGVDPDESVERWFKQAPPFVSTARAALRAHACGADGLCASMRADAERCPAGWSPASGADDARARFLVWPWGHALRFRAPSAQDAIERAKFLRDRSRMSIRIGLVLTQEDEAVTKAPPYERLRELWERVTRRELPADENATGRVVVIEPRELIVLPKLGTIADDAAFEAEVRVAATGLEKIGAPRDEE